MTPPNKVHEARNCVRAFLGDGTPTPEALGRLMEYFYVHDFSPLQEQVVEMHTDLRGLKDTLIEWRASLRTLMIVCAVLGGIISATGTVIGIVVALASLGH